MPTINQLPSIDQVSGGNQIPTYYSGSGDARKMSVSLLQEYMQENLSFPGVASNASGVNYNPAGTGAVQRTVQSKLREYVSVVDFGADPTGATDSTLAIQRALDSIPNGANSYAPGKTSGGAGRVRLLFPSGDYVVSGVLDCSQRDYVQIESDGRATIYSSSTSYILDMSSTDHCVVKNIALYSTTARVGIYIDRCTSAPYAQYNSYENVAITLTTNTSANSGVGRIGIWNGRGELNHFKNVEIRADLPIYSTNAADSNFPPTSGTLQTLFVTSVLNTYVGCLFIGHTAHSPCMVLRGSISHEFIDCYWAQANPASGLLPYAAISYGISSCKFTGTVETLPSFMLIAESIAYFNHIDIAFQNNLDGRGVIQMEDASNTVGLCASNVRIGVTGVIPAGSAALKVVPSAFSALISGNSISCISSLPHITAGSNTTVNGNLLNSEAGIAVNATTVTSNVITSPASTYLSAVPNGVATKIFTTGQFRSYLVTAYILNNGANFVATATVINDGTNVLLLNYVPGAFLTLSVSGADLRVTQNAGGPNDVVCRVLGF